LNQEVQFLMGWNLMRSKDLSRMKTRVALHQDLGFLILALVMAVPSCVAQAVSGNGPTSVSPASAKSADATTVSRRSKALMIGTGDLIKVSVFGAPDYDHEVRVADDGSISLSFIGPQHVAGLSADQAQTLIAEKLQAGGFFTQPQVSVFIKEYATQGVSVLGEVQKPGVYPILGTRSLFDVLSIAGGTTPKAGRVISITHRDNPRQAYTVNFTNNAQHSLDSNVEIYPGDTILVSKADVVYVVGDVHRPSGVVMENGSEMTVLKAIAMAEGTNPDASLNKAKLIRKTSDGPTEIPLQLKEMLSAKKPDLKLQAEDIIFVPNNAAKGATRRGLEAVIQMATGLAIYGAR
jgi:polysaccharide export outer membrane protein